MSALLQDPTTPIAPVRELERSPSSVSLLQRLTERKRAPLCDLSNDLDAADPIRRRLLDTTAPGVAVQRFTLVSRDAPPVKRAPAEHKVLLPPPGLALQLGSRIQVCRCSECPSGKQRRLCRRDTESHGEYALLLSMNCRFEEECVSRSSHTPLVTQACCREKSAYFILGPNSETVGYVAAVVSANRRVPGRRRSGITTEMQVPGSTPELCQIFVEPEFRRKGLAKQALSMLLRGHSALVVDDPSAVILHILSSLGFRAMGARDIRGRSMMLLGRDDSNGDLLQE
mmetsp:Transcript_64460/g.153862  ORF Transcript_64460/g.153862 Transcript_64460/m.153862 type:complete len:285 (-) Transcript_64460:188-1042(-)